MTHPAAPADLAGRVVIITGGGQGIGRVYAKRFAEAGAIPVIADINVENAQSVVAEIESAGGRALAVETDVASEASLAAMVAAVDGTFGRIDVLINNAALFSSLKAMPAHEIDVDVWRQVMDVNVTGQFLAVRAVLPAMKRVGWGRIVNVSSGTVTVGLRNLLHYVTSKAAVVGMTRSLARELGADGINVNVILPGSIETEIPRETVTPEMREAFVAQQCLPRGQVPDDLVGAVMFLSSDASAFVTGQSLAVDGGFTHI